MKRIVLAYSWLLLIMSCFIGWTTSYAESIQFPQTRTGRFIAMIYPKVVTADKAILLKRQRITQDDQAFFAGQRLTNSEQAWLMKVAKEYDLKTFNYTEQSDWHALLARVDIIPPSLVIAQAANESAWGRSRFAVEGNNYFGQHCYSKGCGIVPKRRNPGSRMEVRRFSSVQASVASYIHNLNTHRPYQALRMLRAQQRAKGEVVSGYALAAGLEHYSELDVYVQAIRSVINKYSLARLDKTVVV